MPGSQVAANVRRCTAADTGTIASLGARLFVQAYGATHPEPELSRYLTRAYSPEVIGSAIEEEGSVVFVAEDSDGAPVGYAHIAATKEFPDGVQGRSAFEIVRFYVDGERQRRGVGAALMRACCDAAAQAGGDIVWLQVWTQAPWAIGFYQRMDFSIVGKKPFYFGERTDHDHVMSRVLQPKPSR
jgi:ribosomal protein S18 acetylase RimI-like enzyme